MERTAADVIARYHGAIRTRKDICPGTPVVKAPKPPTVAGNDGKFTQDLAVIDANLSPALYYNEQRLHEESVVASLSRQYTINQDAIFELKPDQQFSVLDCKLLALLGVKHGKDNKWSVLQDDFFSTTGRFLDDECLKNAAEDLDSGARCDQLSLRDQRSLLFLRRKQETDMWLAIMAEFASATGPHGGDRGPKAETRRVW
jgi:hypothetical protein